MTSSDRRPGSFQAPEESLSYTSSARILAPDSSLKHSGHSSEADADMREVLDIESSREYLERLRISVPGTRIFNCRKSVRFRSHRPKLEGLQKLQK